LRGLKQALYILHGLEEGRDNGQIIQEFDGDRQLVEMWTNFLVHNHWIKKNKLGKMMVTEKGSLWIRKYES
jgi:predicted transcriptional regulator